MIDDRLFAQVRSELRLKRYASNEALIREALERYLELSGEPSAPERVAGRLSEGPLLSRLLAAWEDALAALERLKTRWSDDT